MSFELLANMPTRERHYQYQVNHSELIFYSDMLLDLGLVVRVLAAPKPRVAAIRAETNGEQEVINRKDQSA